MRKGEKDHRKFFASMPPVSFEEIKKDIKKRSSSMIKDVVVNEVPSEEVIQRSINQSISHGEVAEVNHIQTMPGTIAETNFRFSEIIFAMLRRGEAESIQELMH